MFEDQHEPNLPKKERFLLSVADSALTQSIPVLTISADQAIINSGIISTSEIETQRIYARLQLMVPAEKSRSLADILNAGWLAYNNPDLWSDMTLDSKKKLSTLKDLVLKNIEVFEIEQIMLEAE